MSEANLFDADIIATGNEITYGQIVDTNSSWIADRLTQSGVIVRKITIVADRIDDIVTIIKDALTDDRRLVVTSGGLGPSEDDLTIDAIAKALDTEPIIGDEALSQLQSRCHEFGIDLNERRRRMARSLRNAQALSNQVGLAPGLMVQAGRTSIFALPGIPDEMKAMFQLHILPRVYEWAAASTRTINVKVFAGNYRFMIFDQIQREFPQVYFKVHGKPPSRDPYDVEETDVTVLARGVDLDSCKSVLRNVVERLGTLLREKGGNLEVKS